MRVVALVDDLIIAIIALLFGGGKPKKAESSGRSGLEV